MEEHLARLYENLIARVSGPLHFRLLLQPLMATIFAVKSGLKDAREGNPPYLWTLFSDRSHRRKLLGEAWKAVGKIFTIAVIIDVIYQFIALRRIYVLDVIITAVLLAIVPYLLLRGPVNRVVHALRGQAVPPSNVRGAK